MFEQLINPVNLIATFSSMIPLIIYVAYFDKEDDGSYLGPISKIIIKNLRNLRKMLWKKQ